MTSHDDEEWEAMYEAEHDKLVDAHGKIGRLESELERRCAELEEARLESSQQAAQVQQLHQQMTIVTSDRDSLRSEVAMLGAEKSEAGDAMAAKLREAKTRIASLETQATEREAKYAEEKRQMEKKLYQQVGAVNEREALMREVKGLKELLAAEKSKVEVAEKEKHEAIGLRIKRDGDLEAAKRKILTLDDTRKNHQSAVAAVRAEYDEKISKLSSKLAEDRKLRSRLANKVKQYEVAAAERSRKERDARASGVDDPTALRQITSSSSIISRVSGLSNIIAGGEDNSPAEAPSSTTSSNVRTPRKSAVSTTSTASVASSTPSRPHAAAAATHTMTRVSSSRNVGVPALPSAVDRQALNKVTSENQNLRKILAETKMQVKEATANAERYGKQLDSVNQARQKLEKKLENTATTLQDIRAKLALETKEKSMLATSVSNHEATIERMRRDLETTRANHRLLANSASMQKDEFDRVRRTAKSAGDVSALKRVIGEQKDVIVRLRSEIAQLEELVRSLTLRLERVDSDAVSAAVAATSIAVKSPRTLGSLPSELRNSMATLSAPTSPATTRTSASVEPASPRSESAQSFPHSPAGQQDTSRKTLPQLSEKRSATSGHPGSASASGRHDRASNGPGSSNVHRSKITAVSRSDSTASVVKPRPPRKQSGKAGGSASVGASRRRRQT